MARARTRKARASIAKEEKTLFQKRAVFCGRHPHSRLGELGCWACAQEAAERERSEGEGRWKAEGAARGDSFTIQTGDGSPALVFSAKPRGRK